MKKTLFTSAVGALEAAFTRMRETNPDDIVPGSTEARDQMSETDWFPIFRSGKYAQGTFSKSDIEEIVEEHKMSGRRAPMTFDHLNKDDLADGAKPGGAAGFLIELRSVEDTDERYAGETLLEARFKVNWHAKWATREGTMRNCSIGIAKFKSPRDGKKRLGIHHLALLGSAVAGVDGLPEVIFSEMATAEDRVNLSFSEMDGVSAKEESMITFADHEAKVAAVKKEVEAELTAKFAKQLEDADKAKSDAEAAAQKAADEAAAAKEAAAKAEADKAAAEAAKAEAEKAAETARAEAVVAVEQAKQEGQKAGFDEGLFEGERRFKEQREKDETISFCASLFKDGKVTEDESKSLPDMIFALPAGEKREQFKSLLSGRAGVPRQGDTTTFSGRSHGGSEKQELTDEQALDGARELMKADPSKFAGIADAVIAFRRNHNNKETI